MQIRRIRFDVQRCGLVAYYGPRDERDDHHHHHRSAAAATKIKKKNPLHTTPSKYMLFSTARTRKSTKMRATARRSRDMWVLSRTRSQMERDHNDGLGMMVWHKKWSSCVCVCFCGCINLSNLCAKYINKSTINAVCKLGDDTYTITKNE